MDLRDRFAAHFAAALVDALADPGQIAERAYDLAEAMLAERARRVDRDERGAIEGAYHHALLDEPVMDADPGYDDDLDPSWLEPPYDPSWDLDARVEEGSRPPGPGLARTVPDTLQDDGRKERSA